MTQSMTTESMHLVRVVGIHPHHNLDNIQHKPQYCDMDWHILLCQRSTSTAIEMTLASFGETFLCGVHLVYTPKPSNMWPYLSIRDAGQLAQPQLPAIALFHLLLPMPLPRPLACSHLPCRCCVKEFNIFPAHNFHSKILPHV